MLGTVVFELDKERTTAPTSPIENATAIPMTIRIRFSVNSARFTKGTIVSVSFPGAASDKSANQRRSLAFARKGSQPKRDSRSLIIWITTRFTPAAQTPRQRSRQRRHDGARCESRRSRFATRLAHRATRGENLHALSENSRRLARSLPVRPSTLSKPNARPRALPQKHLPESVSAWLKVRQCHQL